MAENILKSVQSIYDEHKIKLNNLKDSREKSEKDCWSDFEIQLVDAQINVLASILSDLYREILHNK